MHSPLIIKSKAFALEVIKVCNEVIQACRLDAIRAKPVIQRAKGELYTVLRTDDIPHFVRMIYTALP